MRGFKRKAAYAASCAAFLAGLYKVFILDVSAPIAPAAGFSEPAEKPVAEQKAKSYNDGEKEAKLIDWRDAADHVGGYVRTRGKIVAAKNTGKVCFLNFDKNYRDNLSVVIFSRAYKKFPELPDKMYNKREIEIEGRIKLYKGRVEIIADSPEQIRIIK